MTTTVPYDIFAYASTCFDKIAKCTFLFPLACVHAYECAYVPGSAPLIRVLVFSLILHFFAMVKAAAV